MSDSSEYRMAVNTARMIARYRTCFVGIGVPSLAAILAQRLIAPSISLIYESGVIGAAPRTLPLSTGSPCVALNATMIGRMFDVFYELQAGRIEVGLLSAAQVDQFGNLNSTAIGNYDNPRLRLPGSGGALDISLLANEVIVLMPHEPRRFVAQVDFITSPGGGGINRREFQLGRGPVVIVTDKARFDLTSGTPILTSVFDDVSLDTVLEGFPKSFHQTQAEIEMMPPPTNDELSILKNIGSTSF